jgi:hypothetical protein
VALRDTARLVASLELEDKFTRPADRIDASAGKLEGRFSKLGTGAGKIGGGMAHAAGTIAKVGAVAGAVAVGGGIALLTKAFTAGSASLEELNQVQGRTAAVIKIDGRGGRSVDRRHPQARRGDGEPLDERRQSRPGRREHAPHVHRDRPQGVPSGDAGSQST